jgi:hypothetical protein
MFSNWETTYDSDNSKVKKLIEKNGNQQAKMPVWFKSNYHNYHKTSYNTEVSQGIGLHGDNPKDKFKSDHSKQVDGKLHSDNYNIALGTSKANNFIPGYSGYISYNKTNYNDSMVKDPYFKLAKTNHVINYNVKLSGYGGHVPKNPNNIKGSIRPNCLSINGEKFS